MSLTLAILFVLMILAPCVLALSIRSRHGSEEDGLSLQGGRAVVVVAAIADITADAGVEPVPEGAPEVVAASTPVAAPPVTAAPILSATTAKVAAAVAAAVKAKALAAVAEAATVEVMKSPLELPAKVRVAPTLAPSKTALPRRVETVSQTEHLNPDEMTMEQLLDRAEYEARVAEAAALRASAAASDAAARAAAMRANAAVEAARHARAVATEAAEAARAMRAALNDMQPDETDQQDARTGTEHRRAA